MIFCIKILDCLKVEQRIGGSLVVLIVPLCHFFEVFCSPLGEEERHNKVQKDTAEIDPEVLDWVNLCNSANCKSDVHNNWRDVEEDKSENLGKMVRTLRDNTNNLACLSLEVERKTLVLNMSVYHGCNFHFSIS